MKKEIPNEQRIGVTESGEIAFNLDAFDRLYKANIIITKRLTDELIEKLIEHKEKIILHLTCTGMGGTRIEPFVPKLQDTYKKFLQLIEGGFPVSQVVLRVDPIIPTKKGLLTAMSVLRRFKGLGVYRLRISFLDNYKHVKERFVKENIPVLYGGSFHAELEEREKMMAEFRGCATECGFYSIETCGEPGFHNISCVSLADIQILGLENEITLEGSAEQRKSCGCPANKSELLRVKPHRCENKCLYCYWRD